MTGVVLGVAKLANSKVEPSHLATVDRYNNVRGPRDPLQTDKIPVTQGPCGSSTRHVGFIDLSYVMDEQRFSLPSDYRKQISLWVKVDSIHFVLLSFWFQ